MWRWDLNRNVSNEETLENGSDPFEIGMEGFLKNIIKLKTSSKDDKLN